MVAPNNPDPLLTDQQADRLLAELDAMDAAERFNDGELSNAAISVVVRLDGPSRAIINELLNRFDKLAGIRRDETTGEIIVEPTLWYVIRFEDGAFNMGHGHTACLPEATRYATRQEAEAVLHELEPGATVIEVKTP